MVSSGSHDQALELIEARVCGCDPALAEQLRNGQFDRGTIVYLHNLEQDRFRTFEAATVAAYEDALAAAPLGWRRFGSFVSSFSALKAIVRMDPRASGAASDDVSVVIDDESIWHGPRFVAESLLEVLAGALWEDCPALARRLLEDRARALSGRLDLSYLRSLPQDDAAAVAHAVGFFTVRYSATYETYAPEYLPLMHAALTALSGSVGSAMRSDTVGRPGQEGGR
jgi:hypothetical protein